MLISYFDKNESEVEVKYPSPWIFYPAVLLDKGKVEDVEESKEGKSILPLFHLIECFDYLT